MAFIEEAMTLLHEYKRVLKRYVSPEDRDLKIQTLLLDRKGIKSADEISLYQKLQAVVRDIQSWLAMHADAAATSYSGIEEFCQHVNNFLANFHVEMDSAGNEKIIHTQRLVSRAMVDIVQLLSLPPDQLHGKLGVQLDNCVQVIAKYGDKEQLLFLTKALTARKERYNQAVAPLLNSFRNYMQTKLLLAQDSPL